MIDRLLAAATSHAEMLRQLGLPAEAEFDWLRDNILARARLHASRIHLASVRVADLVAASEESPGPTGLEAAQVEARARLSEEANALTELVGLPERIDVDASIYKRMLVTYTGQVTPTFSTGE